MIYRVDVEYKKNYLKVVNEIGRSLKKCITVDVEKHRFNYQNVTPQKI